MKPSAIYVAGSYTAPTREETLQNVSTALAAGAVLAKAGHFVIVPHAAMPPHFTWERAMELCRLLLHACHSVVLLPGWELSRGACQERAWAEEAGIPVVLLNELLESTT